ncbi:aminopeptidase [Halorarum halophilum]|uniref:Aminopeptidase n=1 Tax=Halorarum halophilum TaxID=2743090 RepID=A0A7D5KM88_9EURY|nr:aminopeptidase [Halobaculum halophilum]QLG28115.1 aminopeptidase [Halobaculum halophilum]
MDDRVWEHAEVLVDWSARVDEGDRVVMDVAEDAHDLAVAVAGKLGERGATLLATYGSDEVTRAYLRGHDDEFAENDPKLSMLEAADVYLRLAGGRNTTATADVPAERRRAAAKANVAVREARMATDWVSTVHPTRSLAQQAGMAYEEYQDFVYEAVLRDWESLADEMANMKEVLDEGSEVRIETDRTDRDGGRGPSRRTDLTMSIENRTAVNSAASVAYDSHNLPSGEVFTAPYATGGEVFFDVPMTIDATRVENVWLEFEGGEVVDFEAEQGADAIANVLDTDEGARRLGELGIGMNRGIDRFTDSILFDEKMGDTVHLALGRAYDSCLPEGETGNDSAVHVDMITDVSEDSRLLVDGEVIQRNGTFRWEEGFEE